MSLSPPSCSDASLVFDAHGQRLLLVTCVDQLAGQESEQIWALGDRGWTLVDGEGPPPAVVTSAAWDSARNVLVRYGGLPMDSNDCIAETWEWNAGGWTMVAGADDARPTACDHMKLAYDANAGLTLLVGGGQLQQLADETWAWDGNAWTRLAQGGPAPRAHHGIAYDDTHPQTLLYGGIDNESIFDDFWSWDGSAWSQIDFPGPGPRSHAGMAVNDEATLLFGGATGQSTFDTLSADTWLLTNGAWHEQGGDGPSSRGSPALAYDPARGVWVMYGGFGPDGAELGDTWQWDGSAWECLDRCEAGAG